MARRAPPPDGPAEGACACCCNSDRLTSTLRGGERWSAHTRKGAISGGVAFWRGTAVDNVTRAFFQSSPVVCRTVAQVDSSTEPEAPEPEPRRASYAGDQPAPPT